MPRPSNPDAAPRRDGYLERRGTWAEVTVGSLLADPSGSRTKIWEVVDSRTAEQIQFAHTPWYQIVERTSGEVHSIPPRHYSTPVAFLTLTDAEALPERTPVGDADRIRLLHEALGATLLATIDHASGEVHCPEYASGHHATQDWHYCAEEIEHLAVMHGLDVSALRELGGDQRLIQVANAHGRLHGPQTSKIPHAGVPHRHVPEDLSLT